MSNRYKEGYERLKQNIKPIIKKYDTSKFRIMTNALFSFIFYGVTPNQFIGFEFYKLNRVGKKMFYTARDQSKYDKKFNDPKYSELFWNKVKFNKKFNQFVKRDWLYSEDASFNEIDSFLTKYKKVILKPTSLSSGKNISVYKGQYTIEEIKKNKFLIEEYCVQHSEMSKLNESSVNTVRVYTILNKENEPEILSISIRVGGKGADVDNFHSGGVGYPVDIETGVVCGSGYDMNGNSYLFHPGSNTKVIGFQIPNYDEMKKFVFKATKVIPQARLIAWDVAILEDGFELIEANYFGDSGFMQTPSKIGLRKKILSKL